MDDPNQENIESSWVLINPIDIAEEATVLDSGKFLDENQASRNDSAESDIESDDGISIISESSHLHEDSKEESNLSNNEDLTHDAEEVVNNVYASSQNVGELKTNWTFVDSEVVPPKMTTSNQFYLNCLQEPVQELSEHELGSVQSDLESDGISIISDCESLNEFVEEDKKLAEGIVVKSNCDNEDPELASKIPSGIKKYCNGVLIGTILLATTSIFLGHYFNSVEQSEEDLPIYKEEFSSDLEEKVPEKINDFKEKYEVPTALAYCQERHKSDEIFMEHNVKKCLNKIEKRIKKQKERAIKEEQMSKLSKYLKIKEKYLQEKEKFLIKREYELIKAEMKLKSKRSRKSKKQEKSEVKISKKASTFRDLNEESKENKKPVTNAIKKKKGYKEELHKNVKSNSKYEKSIKYRKERTRKSFIKYHERRLDNPEYSSSYKYKRENDKKSTQKENPVKYSTRESRETFENHEDDTNFQFDSSKEDNYRIVKDKINKGGTNYIVLGSKNANETISGYWVGRLYKGRSDMRNKRHTGDWYFDRASYRKTKRDKAKWYFDWMMDRELLRYKRSYYM